MYFVTICTKNRDHYFGEIVKNEIRLSEIGIFTKKCWVEIPNHFPHISLDKFVIMPNHIHGIIEIVNPNGSVGNNNYCSLPVPWQTLWSRSLSSAIRGFKIGVVKYCNQNNLCFAWQKSFHDRIIRNDIELNKIREYIINNPKNWEKDRNNAENILM